MELQVRRGEAHGVHEQQTQPGHDVDASQPVEALPHALLEVIGQRVGRRLPERLLRAEVIAEGGLRHAGASADLPRRRATEVLLPELMDRRRHQPLAGLDAAKLGAAGRE